ncbi:hypothetical protein [Hyphomonas sp.]|uniref:hypothetical protein n=1 Tax=Hyphomonas sp. TaxID=87 RepID=UPI001BCC9B4C|nr:hypothetical protein [Hyphomonas sp.]
MHSWRQLRALEAVNPRIDPQAYGSYGIDAAIVAPLQPPMGVCAPAMRFHMKSASRKLGVSGRSQSIRLATTLGYPGQGSGA